MGRLQELAVIFICGGRPPCLPCFSSKSNPDIRHHIYRQFEEVIAKNMLMLPLFHEQTYRIIRGTMEGFEFRHNYPTVNYEQLWMKG